MASGISTEELRAAAARQEIVGTYDVLQEFMGAGVANASKYERMVTLFFDLVGPRLLLPLDQRHVREALAGGLLADGSQFARRQLRREVKQAALRRQAVLDVADDAYTEGLSFKEHEEEIRAVLKRDLAAVGESTKPQRLRDWYKLLDIDDWVRTIADAGNERGQYTIDVGGDCGPTRFPSLWTFIACRLARIPATLGRPGLAAERSATPSRNAVHQQQARGGPEVRESRTDVDRRKRGRSWFAAFHALGIVVVDFENDGGPVQLISTSPAPSGSDLYFYESTVTRTAHEYDVRFAHI